MDTGESKRAMQEALQAAVAKIGNGGGPSPPPVPAIPSLDPMALLMTVLPKLLEPKPDQEGLGDQLDALRKDELVPLREQLVKQRVLLERVFNAQKVLLRKLSAIETVQSALGGAVTSLTAQMARIELVDEPEPEHPRDFGSMNGHAHSRAGSVDFGMDFPLAHEEPRRRSPRG